MTAVMCSMITRKHICILEIYVNVNDLVCTRGHYCDRDDDDLNILVLKIVLSNAD